MQEVKTIFRFLQKKVPLWMLLLAGVIIAVESAQIISEIRLHSDHRRYCIEKIRFASDGIWQNLEYICQNKNDEESVALSLIGAYHYSNDLDDIHYFVLQRVAFSDGKTYRGYDAQKFLTFGYVKSTLEKMLNRYNETHTLSEVDYETVQLFCEEFRNLSEAITENPRMSKEQFADCINALNTSVYHTEDKVEDNIEVNMENNTENNTERMLDQPQEDELTVLAVKKIIDQELEVTISNRGNQTITYGDEYHLEKYEEASETWVRVQPALESFGFHDIGYEVKAGETMVWTVDHTPIYGELENGDYRIAKKIRTADGEETTAYGEFAVKVVD